MHHKKLYSFISLAFEVENTDRVEHILEDEVEKLLDVKARLKVLCYYPSAGQVGPHLAEIAKSVAAHGLKLDSERFLVLYILLEGTLGTDGYTEKLRTMMYEISQDGGITTVEKGAIRFRR